MAGAKRCACPCSLCSPQFTMRVECAPGTCAPLAPLIDQSRFSFVEVWNSILPLMTVDRIHILMCISRTTTLQLGPMLKKEILVRSKCSHRDTLETGILHCFTHRAVFRFSDCLHCGTQAHWHTKVWDEVELEERAGEVFRPRVIMVRREEHKGDGRTARLDFEELAGRLDRLALE